MHPILFKLGPFTLYSFGLLVILGFGAGIMLARRLAGERGLPGDAFVDAAIVVLLSAIAGARLLFVALNWGTYSTRLNEIGALWQGGMSFHGGIVAGVLAGVIYMRRNRLPVLAMADAAAPGMALGYAIGRIGCLMNGCCYGGPTTLPWGMPGIYCEGVPDPSLHYHPAQIYAAVINLALTAALLAAYRRPHRLGQVLALYVGGYSLYRFGIEALRKGVTARVFGMGLTDTQVFSLLAIAAAVAWWFWLERRSPRAPDVRDVPVAPAPAGSSA